jgi:hypothetical protein
MKLRSFFLLMTLGVTPLSMQLIGCGLLEDDKKKSKDEDEDEDKDDKDDEDDEDEGSDDENPKDSVSVENLCAKYMERAEDDEDWKEWTDGMQEAKGDCEDSLGTTSTDFDSKFPKMEGQWLGTLDRCLDKNESVEDYDTCVRTEMTALMEKAMTSPAPGDGEEEAAEGGSEEAAEEGSKEAASPSRPAPKGPPDSRSGSRRGGKPAMKR